MPFDRAGSPWRGFEGWHAGEDRSGPGAVPGQELASGLNTGDFRMARSRAVYHVEYERDPSGWWVGSIREVKGCHTQGRTIAETRRRIREALGLFVGGAERAELVDAVRIPAGERRLLKAYKTARQKAENETRKASAVARRAAKALAGGRLRLSRRDAGEILGLSHQRVQQLIAADDQPGRR
jgi:predicted RNase H-like HicB family nuclease